MKMAVLASSRSTCLRRRVGAVIVKERKILATGYNGAPSGLAHCVELGCLRERLKIPSGQRHELCRGLHAEQNAIVQAACYGVSIKGSVIYVTCYPCSVCAKMIINSGIVEVVAGADYPDEMAQQMLKESSILVRIIPTPEKPFLKR
ncbi:MAG: dCMP deaminase family protein [Candidatus Omnitrophica bacterium]|nr:dCMP deaminase family protein [Candidatus Omnitrophota bacterium]